MACIIFLVRASREGHSPISSVCSPLVLYSFYALLIHSVWFCFAIQFICLLIVFSVVRKMEKKAAGWNIGRHMRQAYNTGASAMASVTPNAKATTAAASKQRDVDKSYDGFTSLAISQAPKIEEIVPKQEESSGGSASSKDKRSLDGFTSIAFSPPTDEEKKRDEPETILNTEEPVSPIHEEEEEEEDEIDGEDDDIILEEEEDDDDLEGEGEEEEEEVGNSSSRIRNKFRRRISQANSQGKVSLPRTKQVGTQALLYCLAFCFTYVFATVNRLLQAGGTSSWTILLLHTLSISMQGFWNVLIYRRPHYLKLRRTHGLTRWQSLQEAFKWTRFKSTSHKEDNGAGVYNRSSRIVTSLVAQSVRMLGQSRQDSAIIRQDSAIISRQDSAIISRQDSAIISRQDSTRIKKSETMTHPTQSTEGGGK